MSKKDVSYPIIDLFAGPGGLGEGFSELYNSDNARAFESVVSIERDDFAHQTLLLRHFFKSFPRHRVTEDYYAYLEGRIEKTDLIARNKDNWEHAKKTALKISLGEKTHNEVQNIIKEGLKSSKKWALIGGPPCQAYSLVGRSRMMGSPEFQEDERHFLYKEYLKIIIDHRPPVFVMENVKGLLSAKVNGEFVVDKIVQDLRNPIRAIEKNRNGLRYKLYSLSQAGEVIEEIEPKSFIVKAEEYGVPQARHRMFILGVRADIDVVPGTLEKSKAPSVEQVISSMPKIRSGISRRKDSLDEWKSALLTIDSDSWMPSNRKESHLIKTEIKNALNEIKSSALENQSNVYKAPRVLRSWYYDERLRVTTGHAARSHMVSDLHRYLYASSHATALDISPKLNDFPEELLPAHKNVKEGCEGKMFSDRFRVQIRSRVSTTITSHISKDGHYFIHYDPAQCRSLSVREAARLQTFPDNYHFEGPRTAQYHQVGNAVPPYLAVQIAAIVKDVLDQMPGD
ncbi:DNA-cytosine methyltransferase [Methylophaga lonarensis MPL]|uniref:DNA (cytosine-5-)-methyltransferase n=1 Tax=Methylophaga lonarensis MPL TaxID=1286106 RepID=M7PR10_9GAMM|nr:DNA cytosine methyltransferase [Methylophaga lonarensis]EMR12874.1 DNA-cytosine methyltransferase [Methylophaga lonarensis MPL]